MWILEYDNIVPVWVMGRNRGVYVWTLQYCVKFELLSVCTGSGVPVWYEFGSGWYFHLQDHSFMQILPCSSVTNPACSPASPFCMVKLHYQDNSYYPTTLTVLPLESPLDFVTACLVLTRTPALGVLDVFLHPSDNLSQQLKSFIPAEENGSIYPETSHQHP